MTSLPQTTPAIRLSQVSRYFGDVAAVNGVSLEVYDGEFFTMLGPSGSGKTTCLRMIAGFDQPTSGSLQLHGIELAGLPPYERDVNTVFQDYALFPHMSVGENIAYGLMIRKVPRPERERRVEEMLELVRLLGYARRRPAELSGGQRQRVALARALINNPRVLLLDEPLGALDLKLRQQMQVELKGLQKRVGITFVFVTHDQDEALTMSDRVAVFNHGRVEQVGSPAELYEHPATAFVAGFVGISNLVSGPVAAAITGSPTMFSIRPEKIHLSDLSSVAPADHYSIEGRVREVIYLGMYTRYLVELRGGGELAVVAQNLTTTSMDVLAAQERPVRLSWRRDHLRLIPDEAG